MQDPRFTPDTPDYLYNQRDMNPDAAGKNLYFLTIMDPARYGGIKIPDYNVDAATTKKILLSFNLPTPTAAGGSTPQILVLFTPHNLTFQTQLWIKWPQIGVNTFTFVQLITPAELLSTNYQRARLVSAVLTAAMSSIATGGAPLQGTIDAVAFQEMVPLTDGDFTTLLPYTIDEKNFIASKPAAEGVVLLAMPDSQDELASCDFRSIISKERIYNLPLHFAGNCSVAGTVNGAVLTPPIFGSITVSGNIVFGVTVATPSTTYATVALQSSVFNLATQTTNLVTVKTYTTTSIQSDLVANEFVSFYFDFINDPYQGPVTQFQFTFFGAATTTFDAHITLGDLEGSSRGFIRPGTAAIINNPAPNTLITFTGAFNYEAVPNVYLSPDVKITTGSSYMQPDDIFVIKRLLSRESQEPRVKLVYTLSEYNRLCNENFFENISGRRTLSNKAFGFANLIPLGMQLLKYAAPPLLDYGMRRLEDKFKQLAPGENESEGYANMGGRYRNNSRPGVHHMSGRAKLLRTDPQAVVNPVGNCLAIEDKTTYFEPPDFFQLNIHADPELALQPGFYEFVQESHLQSLCMDIEDVPPTVMTVPLTTRDVRLPDGSKAEVVVRGISNDLMYVNHCAGRVNMGADNVIVVADDVTTPLTAMQHISMTVNGQQAVNMDIQAATIGPTGDTAVKLNQSIMNFVAHNGQEWDGLALWIAGQPDEAWTHHVQSPVGDLIKFTYDRAPVGKELGTIGQYGQVAAGNLLGTLALFYKQAAALGLGIDGTKVIKKANNLRWGAAASFMIGRPFVDPALIDIEPGDMCTIVCKDVRPILFIVKDFYGELQEVQPIMVTEGAYAFATRTDWDVLHVFFPDLSASRSYTFRNIIGDSYLEAAHKAEGETDVEAFHIEWTDPLDTSSVTSIPEAVWIPVISQPRDANLNAKIINHLKGTSFMIDDYSVVTSVSLFNGNVRLIKTVLSKYPLEGVAYLRIKARFRDYDSEIFYVSVTNFGKYGPRDMTEGKAQWLYSIYAAVRTTAAPQGLFIHYSTNAPMEGPSTGLALVAGLLNLPFGPALTGIVNADGTFEPSDRNDEKWHGVSSHGVCLIAVSTRDKPNPLESADNKPVTAVPLMYGDYNAGTIGATNLNEQGIALNRNTRPYLVSNVTQLILAVFGASYNMPGAPYSAATAAEKEHSGSLLNAQLKATDKGFNPRNLPATSEKKKSYADTLKMSDGTVLSINTLAQQYPDIAGSNMTRSAKNEAYIKAYNKHLKDQNGNKPTVAKLRNAFKGVTKNLILEFALSHDMVDRDMYDNLKAIVAQPTIIDDVTPHFTQVTQVMVNLSKVITAMPEFSKVLADNTVSQNQPRTRVATNVIPRTARLPTAPRSMMVEGGGRLTGTKRPRSSPAEEVEERESMLDII